MSAKLLSVLDWLTAEIKNQRVAISMIDLAAICAQQSVYYYRLLEKIEQNNWHGQPNLLPVPKRGNLELACEPDVGLLFDKLWKQLYDVQRIMPPERAVSFSLLRSVICNQIIDLKMTEDQVGKYAATWLILFYAIHQQLERATFPRSAVEDYTSEAPREIVDCLRRLRNHPQLKELLT